MKVYDTTFNFHENLALTVLKLDELTTKEIDILRTGTIAVGIQKISCVMVIGYKFGGLDWIICNYSAKMLDQELQKIKDNYKNEIIITDTNDDIIIYDNIIARRELEWSTRLSIKFKCLAERQMARSFNWEKYYNKCRDILQNFDAIDFHKDAYIETI